MSIEELNTDLNDSKRIIPKLARTFLLKDMHFFSDVTDGNYKYFISLKIEDGFVKQLKNLISNLKDATRTVLLLLKRIELANSSLSKNSFLNFASNYDETQLSSAISIYADGLSILNLIPRQFLQNLNNFKEEIFNLVSPKKLGDYSNVSNFYKNLVNLKFEIVKLLDDAGLPSDLGFLNESSSVSLFCGYVNVSLS